MDNIQCPKCGGEGSRLVVEDGRNVEDACYHCANTGRISAEQNKSNRIDGLALRLSSQMVDSRRKACNENPEGEGWAFQAAEAGCSEYDYTQSCVVAEFTNVRAALAEFQDNEPYVFEAMLDLVIPDDATKLPIKEAKEVEDDRSPSEGGDPGVPF